MLDSRYEKVSKLFNELLSLNVEQRAEKLRELEKRDHSLADEVSEMLAADEAAEEESFLSMATDETKTHPSSNFDSNSNRSGVPQCVGQYKIREPLGRGAMGVVYRAYDGKSDREIALKMISTGELSSDAEVERFRGEAKAAARLRHANIVAVHDVGLDQGRDYFTMDLVEGENLRDILRRGKGLGTRDAATLIAKVARAVQYAHENNVVHRDIKPSNILIDQDGEPLLTDFGIAKRLDSDEALTMTGQLVGTVPYSAPEQIRDAKDVEPRTDVYGLGATLYECLTVRPPFVGDSLMQTVAQVLTRAPRPPRELHPDVDRDLESICLRCLEKNCEDRYSTAEQLANDLERFMRGDPPEKSRSSWRRSIARAASFKEDHVDLQSSKAAFWVFVTTMLVHPSIFLIVAMNWSHLALWATMSVWFTAVMAINYRFHWSQYWRLTPAERQSGIIQLTCNLSFVCLLLIHGPLTLEQPITDFLSVYPPFCLVLAVAVSAHGGFHAGRWILIGFLYLPLSLVIAWLPTWGPLIFAVFGTAILGLATRELRYHAARNEINTQ